MLALPADVRRLICLQADGQSLLALDRSCSSFHRLMDEKFWQGLCEARGWPKARYRGWKWTGLARLLKSTQDATGLRIGSSVKGHAVVYYKDGIREGYWDGSEMNGLGFSSCNEGYCYEGMFLKSSFHGLGTYFWPDGSCYLGHRVLGRKSGRAMHVWAGGKIYVGNFEQGETHGHGVYRWPDGRLYIGILDMGMRKTGVYRWPDSSRYRGTFNGDGTRKHGKMTWPDGSSYDGPWKGDHAPGCHGKRWAGFFLLSAPDRGKYVVRLCGNAGRAVEY